MYKYSCRKCPIRNRCIQESDTSPSAKEMIRNAFAARTDTLATWAVLQKNCLLVKAEERRARIASEESLLSRRLREVREAKKQAEKPPSPEEKRQTPEYLKPVSSPLSYRSHASTSSPTQDLVEPPASDSQSPTSTMSFRRQVEPARPCWLTVNSSQRHIALPATGELVLGRFDPNLGIPPDVDLAYEDWDRHSVSRRHARITGKEGHHTIEDLGSRNGLYLNGAPIAAGQMRPLQAGDQIELGELGMVYDLVPITVLNLRPGPTDRHILILASNGHRMGIAPAGEIVIGRSDRYVDFRPDIDLSDEGEVAIRVSRRHAVISWRKGNPYIEDLGSGFGTRLNGQTLLIGQAEPLKPGDHIWLGGCVLAYEVEI